MQDRRTLFGAIGAGIAALFGWRALDGDSEAAPARTFEISKTAAEWRQQLSSQQFHVLREHGTEWAGSSPLNREKRRGVFSCAGCNLPLFSSDTKY